MPEYVEKCNIEEISEAAQYYEDDLPGSIIELNAEIKLWISYWKSIDLDKRPKRVIEAFWYCYDTKFYPNIQVLLHLLSISPLTSNTAERSFSTLRRMKTYLWSTMSE
jgi:hypothetical protein